MLNASIVRALLALSLLFSFTSGAWAQSPEYTIEHVTVINPGSAKPLLDATVVIRGQTIISVTSKSVALPASTKVINGQGKFLIPGLWDMHMHFRDAKRDLKMDLANGVLGLRDMGDDVKEVFPLRNAYIYAIVVNGQVLDRSRLDQMLRDARVSPAMEKPTQP